MKPIAVYIINKIRYFLPCSLLIVLFGYAQLAQSQIEEIVVTATKRGDTLIQDIPLSVQAISGDSLRETGALDFNDYYRQIPGLSVVDQGPGDKRYIHTRHYLSRRRDRGSCISMKSSSQEIC